MLKMEDIIEVRRCSKHFKISWKMTNWCNYRCSYCYMSKSVIETITNPSIEHLLKIASKIDDIINFQAKNRPVILHLIGGEVGYFDLIKIISHIKSEQLKRVIIATNFSSSKIYWLKLLKYLDSRKIALEIIASLHLEQCNEKDFKEKIKLFNHNNIVTVKCVINDNNAYEYKNFFKDFENVKIIPTLERKENNINSNCSEKTIKYIKFLNDKLKKYEKPYYIVTTKNCEKKTFYSNVEMINNIEGGGFNPEGFSCTAGLDGVRIDVDGSLRRAGCQWCGKQENWLGSLTTGEYKLPTEPIICHTTIQHKFLGERHKFCTAFGNTSMERI